MELIQGKRNCSGSESEKIRKDDMIMKCPFHIIFTNPYWDI
jgi:hypothetical protein